MSRFTRNKAILQLGENRLVYIRDRENDVGDDDEENISGILFEDGAVGGEDAGIETDPFESSNVHGNAQNGMYIALTRYLCLNCEKLQRIQYTEKSVLCVFFY